MSTGNKKNNLSTSHIAGGEIKPDYRDFSEEIEFSDSKINFVHSYTKDKKVLDLGCVQHNKKNYNSKYWLHKAINFDASSVVGLDLSEDGVNFLNSKGLNVIFGDATSFDLGEKFDVIVAGDLVEHLSNFDGFLLSCRNHLSPNGCLLITTPNPWHWKFILRAITRGGHVPVNPEHTCWLCPTTLSQLVRRSGFSVTNVEYGSRYLRDRLIPLPKGLKHTSFYAALKVSAI
jgi:2-polyprenyl-3-methyl-5-hydroxy-6-metoxy-1,4-benzoquinol methylase